MRKIECEMFSYEWFIVMFYRIVVIPSVGMKGIPYGGRA